MFSWPMTERRAMKLLGVTGPVEGTLGILDLAAEHGLADFSDAVGRLMQTNFRASGKLIQFFMDRDARRKKY